ncbi:hypothetical protein RDABS01_018914 [Bienertia sinuspersici]
MDSFRAAIDQCSLKDLGFKGSAFTWQRGNDPATLIRERLDRFLANEEWCSLFPDFEVRHFPVYRFDHALICLKMDEGSGNHRRDKLFRFETFWMSNDECRSVIVNAWNESPGMNVATKLEVCATKLKDWANRTFGDIKKRIKIAEKNLKTIQNMQPDRSILEKGAALANELDELHRLQESYWYARARANDLRDGDKNTRYFHHKASQRRRRNHIKGIMNSSGGWCEKTDEIAKVVASYFEEIFATENPSNFEEALEGDTFIEEDRKKILALPLSTYLPPDGCYWWPSKYGEYTVGAIMWAAWFSRNKAMHKPEVRTNIITAAGFIKLVVDYVEYASRVFKIPHIQATYSTSWSPPPMGWVKVNTDANVITGEKVSIGAVIRDEKGALKAFGVKVVGPASVEIAKAEAARYGLMLARRLGFLRIILECDAIGVINAINSKKQGETPIFLLFEDIQSYIRCFDDFLCSHVKRTGNTVAHLVAR